jgi:hypothetical protein
MDDDLKALRLEIASALDSLRGSVEELKRKLSTPEKNPQTPLVPSSSDSEAPSPADN